MVGIADEPWGGEVVRGYLERDGYLVYVAGNGAEGLSLAERTNPGLIVLDLMLPDVSGEEICREIRSRSDVPILMLTARDEDVDKIIGLELGADDYVAKPFDDIGHVLARLDSVIDRRLADRLNARMVGDLTAALGGEGTERHSVAEVSRQSFRKLWRMGHRGAGEGCGQ